MFSDAGDKSLALRWKNYSKNFLYNLDINVKGCMGEVGATFRPLVTQGKKKKKKKNMEVEATFRPPVTQEKKKNKKKKKKKENTPLLLLPHPQLDADLEGPRRILDHSLVRRPSDRDRVQLPQLIEHRSKEPPLTVGYLRHPTFVLLILILLLLLLLIVELIRVKSWWRFRVELPNTGRTIYWV
ncbi:hypothetical protein HK104_002002 [Borealophlyctis nickersoniae]|nr:hypothetical protein HK104_002002 [Borealophlyctis nickersoniae]